MLFQKKIHFKIAPSKNAFQNFNSQKTHHNRSLKKCISKIFISKIHLNIAPSEDAFQNCYLSSIVIEGIRTLFFSQKNLKGKKHKFNFSTNQKRFNNSTKTITAMKKS